MFFIHFIIIIIICITNTKANTNINQERILKNLENNLHQELEKKKLNYELQDQRKSIKFPNISPKENPTLPSKSNKTDCNKIKHIKFTDAKNLSNKNKNKINSKFLGKCININTINNIIRTTTNHYISKGYVTTKAFIVPQDSASGMIEILVTEGTIESIEFDEKTKGKINLSHIFHEIFFIHQNRV